jgi:nucleotide-binding universal stress UspA family protein
MYERVLVPVDGSKTADAILAFAEKVAGPLDVEVMRLHAISDAKDEFGFPTRVQAEAYLSSLAERLSDKGIHARTGIRFGSVPERSSTPPTRGTPTSSRW